jgi:hypothetical protein
MNFSKLCTPAMIYFVVAVITLVIGVFTNFHILSLLIKGLFILVWTWFLNYLCKKGYSVISWILVLLPFLMMFGVIAMAMEVVKGSVKPAALSMK